MDLRNKAEFEKILNQCRYDSECYEKFRAFIDIKIAGWHVIDSKRMSRLLEEDFPEDFKTLTKTIIAGRLQFDEKRVSDFLKLENGKELAVFFDVSYSYLLLALNLIPGREEKARYTEFTIPKKSGGVRQISAPNKQLLTLQKGLAYILNLIYDPPKSAHGFISAKIGMNGISNVKNIITNAKQHKGRKLILNLDLKDFFSTITGPRVFRLFQSAPFNFNPKVAGLLTEICINEKTKALPQGAATSPVISNMIALRMDLKLTRLAAESGVTFTRYADDITFSTSRQEFTPELINKIRDIIREEGFILNEAKFRIQDKRGRQEVTGITVNKKLNVQRKYVRNVRAMLNNWEKRGIEFCQARLNEKYMRTRKEGVPDFKKVLLGKIEYIGAVRGKSVTRDPQEIYSKLIGRYYHILNEGRIDDKLTNENMNNQETNDIKRTDLLDYLRSI